MNGYIQSKDTLRIVHAWDGLEEGGGIFTKQNLKSDSAPETTFFADKAQSVAGLLDKFKS